MGPRMLGGHQARTELAESVVNRPSGLTTTTENMMKKTLLFATCAALAFAVPATAQSVGEKTGVNSALGITPKTEDFVKEVALSDMFEIESSKLAAQKGN